MNETITKADVAEHISEVSGFSYFESKRCVELFLEAISEQLVAGKTVKLYGFGNFSLLDKPARWGRNPKTLEDVLIVARRVISFRVGKKLKKRVEHSGK